MNKRMDRKKLLSVILSLSMIMPMTAQGFAETMDLFHESRKDVDSTYWNFLKNIDYNYTINKHADEYFIEGNGGRYYSYIEFKKEERKKENRDIGFAELLSKLEPYLRTDDGIGKNLLKEANEKAPKLNKEAYADQSWSEYAASKAELEQLSGRRFVKEKELKSAIARYTNAVDGLKKKSSVDTSELERLVSEGKSEDLQKYTEETASAYTASLNEGESLLNNPELTKEEVAQAVENINTAHKNLEIDYELKIAEVIRPAAITIKKGESIRLAGSVYVKMTDKSHEKVDVEWNEHEENAENAGKLEITGTVKGKEVVQVVNVVEDTDVNKSGLEEAINRAVSFSENKYSESSYRELAEAVESGREVNQADDSEQKSVDEATSNILGAISNLKEEEPSDRIVYVVDPDPVTVNVGDSVSLPDKVEIALNNGVHIKKAVEWSSSVDTSEAGEKVIKGKIEGTNKRAHFTVKVVEKKKVDKEALKDALDKAGKIEKEKYTDGSNKYLQDNVKAAEKVYKDSEATAGDVLRATENLKYAMEHMQEKIRNLEIKNLLPKEDINVRAGKSFKVSFEAEQGGKAGAIIALPGSKLGRKIKPNMTEVSPGKYEITMTVPKDNNGDGFQIFVSFTNKEGKTVYAVADGKINVVKNFVVTYDLGDDNKKTEEVRFSASPESKKVPKSEKEDWVIDYWTMDGKKVNPSDVRIFKDETFVAHYKHKDGRWINLKFTSKDGIKFKKDEALKYEVNKSQELNKQNVKFPEIESEIPRGKKVIWVDASDENKVWDNLNVKADKDTELVAKLVEDTNQYDYFTVTVEGHGKVDESKLDSNKKLKVLKDDSADKHESKEAIMNAVRIDQYYDIDNISIAGDKVTVTTKEKAGEWFDVEFKYNNNELFKKHVHKDQTLDGVLKESGKTLDKLVEGVKTGEDVVWYTSDDKEANIDVNAPIAQSAVYTAKVFANYTVVPKTNGHLIKADKNKIRLLNTTEDGIIESKAKELVAADTNYEIDKATINKEKFEIEVTFKEAAGKWTDITVLKGVNGNFKHKGQTLESKKIHTPVDKTFEDIISSENIELLNNDGYKFSHWEIKKSGEENFAKVEIADKLAKDAEYRPVFEKDPTLWKQVDFEAGENGTLEGYVKPEEKLVNTLWTAIQVPTPKGNPGYEFKNWSPELPKETEKKDSESGEMIKVPAQITENQTYTAIFEKKDSDWVKLNFTFKDEFGAHAKWNGEAPASKDVIKGQTFEYNKVTIPSLTVDKGYKYTWKKSENGKETEETPTAKTKVGNNDCNYIAEVQENENEWITIDFKAGDNGKFNDEKTEIEVPVVKGVEWKSGKIPTPIAKPGFKFSHWEVNNDTNNKVEQIPNTTPNPENTTKASKYVYKAVFVKDDSQYRTISFELPAGEKNGRLEGTSSQEVLTGTKWSDINWKSGVPTAIPKEGYLAKWNPELPTEKIETTQKYTLSFEKNGDMWKQVTFNRGTNGTFKGNHINDESYKTEEYLLGSKLNAFPEIEVNPGYNFTGWKSDTKKIVKPGVEISNANGYTFTAQYAPQTDKVYTINMVQVDEHNQPVKDLYGRESIIKTEKREGQTFGKEVTVNALTSNNFEVVGDTSKTITIDNTDQTVTFYWKPTYQAVENAKKEMQKQVSKAVKNVKIKNEQARAYYVNTDTSISDHNDLEDNNSIVFEFDDPNGDLFLIYDALAGSGIFTQITSVEDMQRVTFREKTIENGEEKFGKNVTEIKLKKENGTKLNPNELSGQLNAHFEDIFAAFGINENASISNLGSFDGLNALVKAEGRTGSGERIIFTDIYKFVFRISDRKIEFNSNGLGKFEGKENVSKKVRYNKPLGNNIPSFTAKEGYKLSGYTVEYDEAIQDEETYETTIKKVNKKVKPGELKDVKAVSNMVVTPTIAIDDTQTYPYSIKVEKDGKEIAKKESSVKVAESTVNKSYENLLSENKITLPEGYVVDEAKSTPLPYNVSKSNKEIKIVLKKDNTSWVNVTYKLGKDLKFNDTSIGNEKTYSILKSKNLGEQGALIPEINTSDINNRLTKGEKIQWTDAENGVLDTNNYKGIKLESDIVYTANLVRDDSQFEQYTVIAGQNGKLVSASNNKVEVLKNDEDKENDIKEKAKHLVIADTNYQINNNGYEIDNQKKEIKITFEINPSKQHKVSYLTDGHGYFNEKGKTTITKEKQLEGTVLSDAPIPTANEGYNFKGWKPFNKNVYLTTEQLKTEKVGTGDITYTAVFEPQKDKKYTIKMVQVNKNGKNIANNEFVIKTEKITGQTYDADVTVSAPELKNFDVYTVNGEESKKKIKINSENQDVEFKYVLKADVENSIKNKIKADMNAVITEVNKSADVKAAIDENNNIVFNFEKPEEQSEGLLKEKVLPVIYKVKAVNNITIGKDTFSTSGKDENALKTEVEAKLDNVYASLTPKKAEKTSTIGKLHKHKLPVKFVDEHTKDGEKIYFGTDYNAEFRITDRTVTIKDSEDTTTTPNVIKRAYGEEFGFEKIPGMLVREKYKVSGYNIYDNNGSLVDSNVGKYTLKYKPIEGNITIEPVCEIDYKYDKNTVTLNTFGLANVYRPNRKNPSEHVKTNTLYVIDGKKIGFTPDVEVINSQDEFVGWEKDGKNIVNISDEQINSKEEEGLFGRKYKVDSRPVYNAVFKRKVNVVFFKDGVKQQETAKINVKSDKNGKFLVTKNDYEENNLEKIIKNTTLDAKQNFPIEVKESGSNNYIAEINLVGYSDGEYNIGDGYKGNVKEDGYYIVNRKYTDNTKKTYDIGKVKIEKDGVDVTDKYTFKFLDKKDGTEKKKFDLSKGGSTFTAYMVATGTSGYKNFEGNVVFKYGSVTIGDNEEYMTIEDALNETKNISGSKIIVKHNTSFADSEVSKKVYGTNEFKVAKGNELLVPFNDKYTDKVEYTEAGKSDKTEVMIDREKPAYSTLLINSGVNVKVEGDLKVLSLNTGGGSQGTSHVMNNHYGQIEMLENSSIELLEGGKLFATGFVYGEGKIISNVGASVSESLNIYDFRGGSQTVGISKHDIIFPFDTFMLNNIEVPVTVNKGSEYIGLINTYVRGSRFGDIKVIGKNKDGIFDIESGKILKEFNQNTGKMTFNIVDGKSTINDISMILDFGFLIGKVDVDSKGKEIPVSGVLDVVVKNNSTLDINASVKLLPGEEFKVEKGGTLNIANGSKMFIYDKNQYVLKGNANFIYLDKKWLKNSSRLPITLKFNSKDDAKLIVEGNLNVEGALGGKVYVRNGGQVDIENGIKEVTINHLDYNYEGSGFNTVVTFFDKITNKYQKIDE